MSNTEHNTVLSYFDLDEHISFVQDLIKRYDWDENVLDGFQARLARIKSKQADELLNLTVVGEFSTGKSTFINALLRTDEFLVSGALQGTTVAASIIEYSDSYALTASYGYNGDSIYKEFDSLEQLQEGLVVYTTDPELAKGLSSVTINIPSEALQRGFRIVDTPGTASVEKWHEEVTIRTVKEISDLVVLIIDITKPLPESFCAFVRANLSDMLDQCIFVATKVDLLRKKERDDVLAYLENKLSISLDIEDPFVLPYSAVEILEADSDKESEILKLSLLSEEKMISYMANQRKSAQAKKLIGLTDELLVSVSSKIGEFSENYNKDLEVLKKSRHAPLESFVTEQKETRSNSFSNTVDSLKYGLINKVYRLVESCVNNINVAIRSQQSVEYLNAFVNNGGLDALCKKEANNITDILQPESNNLEVKYSEEIELFISEFEKKFEELNIVKMDFRTADMSNLKSSIERTQDFAVANTYVSRILKDENRSYLGGAAAGAAVGTAILPGVGTMIGGVIGFIFGAGAAPKIEAVREETVLKLKDPLNNYFISHCEEIIKLFENHAESLKFSLLGEIYGYWECYNSTVDKWISDEEEKIEEIENSISIIKWDTWCIDGRKKELDNMCLELNELSRKEKKYGTYAQGEV